MRRKYNMSIEGLMVEITYDFIEGDEGDYWTPPVKDRAIILGWELAKGKTREEVCPELSEEEWEDWMHDIDRYVCNDAVWDILEFENELKY